MKLSAYLFDELWKAGVRHIFGIPGDFVLNLYEALERDGRFGLVRFSHEPAVGFAADGSSRITGGLGVCCVTYGAGGLNMVNPVACAYAEESPLVVISGGPGLVERRAGVQVHHEVKSFDSQRNVYAEVTAYAAILDDPETAALHVVRALDVARKLKRPVYLEIPRDMVSAEIRPPAADAALHLPTDEGAVREAVDELITRLTQARRPVIIVGVEIHRFQLRGVVRQLAERLNIPVASSFLGRGVFPSRDARFIGTYLGRVSPSALRDRVENSDCVLLLGEHISDTSLGVSAHRLDAHNLLIAVARDVFIGHHRYEQAPLDRVLPALLARPDLPAFATVVDAGSRETTPSPPAREAGDLRVLDVIDAVNAFLDVHPDVPLVADTGDALFASVDIRSNDCLAPAYYATMGFAIPAALGLQVSSGRRPVVLVGDGAFQMTGSEISHAPALDCNPIVILLDNRRWEMLQAFFPDAGYNTTPGWPYAALAALWGGAGRRVTTPADLSAALDDAWREERFVLIEVPLERGDISPVLRRFVEEFQKRLATQP